MQRWTGLALWLAWMALLPPHGLMHQISRLVGLAMLVGLAAVIRLATHGATHAVVVWATRLQLPTALLAVVALSLSSGWLPAALALPWLAETLLLASWGVIRWRQGSRAVEEGVISIGLLYLPIGAAWLVASRAGFSVLGFVEPIVLLTAMHFHYAGCLAPCLAGVLGRAVPGSSGWYRLLAIGVGLGPPLVAAGITFSNWVEPLSGVLLGTSLLGTAVLALWKVVPRLPGLLPRLGLVTSGLCGIAAMLLAVSYALRDVYPQYALDIPDMIVTHGLLNSIGFTTVGLLSCQSVLTKAQ